jgi:hypothetical protein
LSVQYSSTSSSNVGDFFQNISTFPYKRAAEGDVRSYYDDEAGIREEKKEKMFNVA